MAISAFSYGHRISLSQAGADQVHGSPAAQAHALEHLRAQAVSRSMSRRLTV
jgi:hypothetical protein